MFHFSLNLLKQLDLLLNRQQNEDADIKRSTGRALSQILKRVEMRKITVASLSPKREVKTTGEAIKTNSRIFLYAIVSSVRVGSWHNIYFI